MGSKEAPQHNYETAPVPQYPVWWLRFYIQIAANAASIRGQNYRAHLMTKPLRRRLRKLFLTSLGVVKSSNSENSPRSPSQLSCSCRHRYTGCTHQIVTPKPVQQRPEAHSLQLSLSLRRMRNRLSGQEGPFHRQSAILINTLSTLMVIMIQQTPSTGSFLSSRFRYILRISWGK